jgi:hypothetical protein
MLRVFAIGLNVLFNVVVRVPVLAPERLGRKGTQPVGHVSGLSSIRGLSSSADPTRLTLRERDARLLYKLATNCGTTSGVAGVADDAVVVIASADFLGQRGILLVCTVCVLQTLLSYAIVHGDLCR